MSKILVNKTIGTVHLNGGAMQIAPGGTITISNMESEIPEVMNALRHGIVEMVDTQGEVGNVPLPEMPAAPVIENPGKVINEVEAPSPKPKASKKVVDAVVVEETTDAAEAPAPAAAAEAPAPAAE
jgi:hypothetical protein